MSAYKDGYCKICGEYKRLGWHHVFNGNKANKQFSEKHNAIVWACWPCHETNKDSIHNNAKLRLHLKGVYQEKIMLEQGWSIEDWIANTPMKKSYLHHIDENIRYTTEES